MKRIKEAWARLKAKHWDEEMIVDDSPHVVFFGFNRPPLRSFWESHKTSIITTSKWLAALIVGAAILRAIGLG
ncbi:hypothetical protein D9M69_423980 [compost metagenome]